MRIVSVLVVFASPLVSAFGSLPALNPGHLVANTTTGLCSTAEQPGQKAYPSALPPSSVCEGRLCVLTSV